jgi:hypothetical protein
MSFQGCFEGELNVNTHYIGNTKRKIAPILTVVLVVMKDDGGVRMALNLCSQTFSDDEAGARIERNHPNRGWGRATKHERHSYLAPVPHAH